MDSVQLFLGLMFSTFGLGFFMYGKQQSAPVPLYCGLILMVFPLFVSNTTLLVVVGVALSVLPFVLV
ncbi:MAG: amino acid transport protein [Gammaproteobacteria bacterium]